MYISQAAQGDNRWWKYLLSVLVILGSFLLGQIPLTLFAYFKKEQIGLSEESFTEALNTLDYRTLEISENTLFFLIMLTFVFSFLSVILIVPMLHKRSVMSFLTARKRFDLKRFFTGLLIWFILASVLSFLILKPEQYEYTFKLETFIPLVVISLLLVPMQCATEEIVYRGFIMQGIYQLTQKKWLSLVIVTLLFALSHAFNPEFEQGFLIIIPVYLIFSFTMTYITILDNGLELSMGMHTGNNLFVSLILSASGAAVTTPSVFQTSIESLISVLPVLLSVLSVLSFVLLKLIYKWGYRV